MLRGQFVSSFVVHSVGVNVYQTSGTRSSIGVASYPSYPGVLSSRTAATIFLPRPSSPTPPPLFPMAPQLQVRPSPRPLLPSRSPIAGKTKAFTCPAPDCSHGSDRKSNIQRHYNAMHAKAPVRPLKCCGTVFADRQTYSEHQRTAHTDSDSYRCLKCDFRSASKTQLRLHSGIHDPAGNQCCSCGYNTSRRSNFKRHLEAHKGHKMTSSGDVTKCRAGDSRRSGEKTAVSSTSRMEEYSGSLFSGAENDSNLMANLEDGSLGNGLSSTAVDGGLLSVRGVRGVREELEKNGEIGFGFRKASSGRTDFPSFPTPFRCKACGVAFSKVKFLWNHMSTHGGNPVQ